MCYKDRGAIPAHTYIMAIMIFMKKKKRYALDLQQKAYENQARLYSPE